MTTYGYFFSHAQEVKGNLGDQLGGPGTPAKMLGEPEGLPEIFPRVQPCSPVVIGSMIHYMLLLNVEAHFLRTLVKECKF